MVTQHHHEPAPSSSSPRAVLEKPVRTRPTDAPRAEAMRVTRTPHGSERGPQREARTLRAVDDEIGILENDLAAIRRAWESRDASQKREGIVAIHNEVVAGADRRLARLLAERAAITANPEGKVEQRALDEAIAPLPKLHIETGIEIDARDRVTQPFAQWAAHSLEEGARLEDVIDDLDKAFASGSLSFTDHRACEDLRRKLTGTDVAVVAAPEKITAAPTIAADTFVRKAPPTTVTAVRTPSAASRSTAPDKAPVAKSSAKSSSRATAAPAKAERKTASGKGKKAVEYHAPATIEPLYHDDGPRRRNERPRYQTEDEWLADGERTHFAPESLTPAVYKEPYLKLAQTFGGPDAFKELHEEATRAGLVRFTLNDAANANVLERWWYTRQMKNAAEEMVRRDMKKNAKAKKPRGKLQA